MPSPEPPIPCRASWPPQRPQPGDPNHALPTVTYSWVETTPTFLVNNLVTAGSQQWPAIAANATGSAYLSVWYTPGVSLYVMGRLVGADGTPLGNEFQINTTATNDQYQPSATGLSNGNYVVSFTDTSADPGGDIRFRIINGTGAGGSDILVDGSAGDDSRSDVAALAGGGFAVAFQRDLGGGDVNILMQRYHANGSANGAAIVVNASNTVSTTAPSIMGLANGGCVVAWTQTALAGGNSSVWFQRFDSAGAASAARPSSMPSVRTTAAFRCRLSRTAVSWSPMPTMAGTWTGPRSRSASTTPMEPPAPTTCAPTPIRWATRRACPWPSWRTAVSRCIGATAMPWAITGSMTRTGPRWATPPPRFSP
jgi:hypothetical protein